MVRAAFDNLWHCSALAGNRQAIDALEKSGMVYREQGRGTFVAEPRMHSVLGFTSFSQDMQSRGRRPSSLILNQQLVQVDEKLQKTLKIGPDDLALHLMRVRLADDQPMSLQTAYLPYSLCPGLELEDLSNQSLFTVLREKYSVNPAWTEAEMEVQTASEAEAGYLHIEKNDPVLIVNGITFTDSLEIVETVRTVYRGKDLALYIGRQRITAAR